MRAHTVPKHPVPRRRARRRCAARGDGRGAPDAPAAPAPAAGARPARAPATLGAQMRAAARPRSRARRPPRAHAVRASHGHRAAPQLPRTSVATWSPQRLRARATDAPPRRPRAARRAPPRRAATAGGRSVASPGAAGDRRLRVGRQPRGPSPATASTGQVPVHLQTWASVGGTGNPAAAPEAEQDRRAAKLYARAGAAPVARLRPVAEPCQRPVAAWTPPPARRVPGPRPPRVPQRGHLRAAAGGGASTPPRAALERGAPRRPRRGATSRRARACASRLRAAYAGALGADAADVALTTCDQRRHRRVLAGLDLGPGDEILTARRRAPRPARPAGRARAQRGVRVRAVPFADARRRGRPDARGSSPARTSPGSRGEVAPGGARRASTCRCCSTAPRAPARSPSTSRRSAARSTPARARSGCAARSAPGCCGSPPPGASGCAPLGADAT